VVFFQISKQNRINRIDLSMPLLNHCRKMTTIRPFPSIKAVNAFVVQGKGGGDYHDVDRGHWLVDSKISTPMSQFEKYRSSRTSWGINVLGSFCVEIEATDGTKGFATGFGGISACWMVTEHFERFLIGSGMSPSIGSRGVLLTTSQIREIRTSFSNRCTEPQCSTAGKGSLLL
jgi:hypothetical protein